MATVLSAPAGTVLDAAAVQALRDRVRGEVLRPGETGYDPARTVWNAMIDRRPALIVRCAGAADAIAAVAFARDTGLPLSIKGGGHGVAGKAVTDGGLMVDLSRMKGIRIDPVARTARAEPGLLWEEFDRETQAFGLATVGGTVATTGIAGLTLGGGHGWLTGKFGAAVDNLLAVDVVTADGELVQAGAEQNPDLFWAMRGAGANFGVATSFVYRLHPVGPVLGGMVIHPLDRGSDVLRFYREFAASQPDELTTYAAVLTGPDGGVVVALVACYCGSIEDGESVLAPLRGFGQPVADTFGPLPYVAMQAMLGGGFPHGRLNYWKSGLTDRITDATIAAIVEYGSRIPSPFSAIVLLDYHGAFGRVGKNETAHYHRDLPHDLVILSSWTDPAASDENIRWTRELFGAVESEMPGVYVNGLDVDDGRTVVHRAYGENWARLAALKRQ